MKRKILSALLLILIGGGLMAAGYWMGGKPRAFAIGPIFGFKNEGRPLHSRKSLPAASIDQTVLTDDSTRIKRLFVDISSASLEIVPHDEDGFTYAITNNTDKVNAAVQIKHDALYITTKKHKAFSKWFHIDLGGGNTHRTAITVNIPAHFIFETVDITSGVGEIVLDGFQAQRSFALTTGIAESEVKNITASNVHIQTGVGQAEFRNCTFTDTVMQTGVGEVLFEGNILKKFDIDSGVGSADLRINGKKDDYRLDIDSGIGEVLVDGAHIGSFGGSVRAAGSNAEHHIRIQSGIGEVRLRFKS
ncbi:MAG: DUF4097 family beta strand repeat-containing protein [Treponema sp.]